MKAWAICDTDGGRIKPKPLIRFIYATKEEAAQVAQIRGFEYEYYPVIEVEVLVEVEK